MKTRTRTIFLINKKGDDLFAFFPDDYYNRPLYGDGVRWCYARVGQHSACNIRYAKASIDALPEQYESLKKELESIGYEIEVCDKSVLN